MLYAFSIHFELIDLVTRQQVTGVELRSVLCVADT